MKRVTAWIVGVCLLIATALLVWRGVGRDRAGADALDRSRTDSGTAVEPLANLSGSGRAETSGVKSAKQLTGSGPGVAGSVAQLREREALEEVRRLFVAGKVDTATQEAEALLLSGTDRTVLHEAAAFYFRVTRDANTFARRWDRIAEMLQARPLDPAAIGVLADILAFQGRMADSAKKFGELARLTPNEQTYSDYARASERAGSLDGLREAIGGLNSVSPDNRAANLLMLAKAEMKGGDLKNAAATCEAVLNLPEASLPTQFAAARILTEAEQYDRATVAFQEMSKSNQRETQQLAEIELLRIKKRRDGLEERDRETLGVIAQSPASSLVRTAAQALREED